MTDYSQIEFKDRMQPIIASRAMRKLLKDKEKTEEVFVILRALGGNEIKKNYKRFCSTETGRKILAEKREIIDALNDRDALAAMPEGSLGRAYLEFVIRENLSADGLMEASELGDNREKLLSEDMKRYQLRQRDTHDLWHVITDYGRDGLGELCLLAFTYAQTRNRGLAFIITIATIKDMRDHPPAKVFRAVREGYRHGKRATWFNTEDWEFLLTQPIDEVRKHLNFNQPEKYRWSLQKLIDLGADDIVGDIAPA